MAIWQLEFYIIHREYEYTSLSFDNIISWKDKTFMKIMPDFDFLPRKKSWSDSIIQYGELDSDCIEFLLSSEKQIEEIECRLDMRCFTKEKLEIILAYVNQIKANIYINGKIVSPQMKEIIPIIRESYSVRFCMNPKKFLDLYEGYQ